MKMVHRFTYPLPARTDRRLLDEMDDLNQTTLATRRNKLHWLRDGEAGTFYASKLAIAGYEFSLEFNLPAPGNAKADRGATAVERLKKDDILLVNTRPPLTNDTNHLLAPIRRSDSWVEDRIIDVLKEIFTTCSRDEVVLSIGLAGMLQERYEKRAKLKFMTRPEVYYTQRASINGEYEDVRAHRTAGYLIYAREIWPNGPDLLCSFAMSGPMNLVWSYLLATRFASYILPSGKERFFMADIIPPIAQNGDSEVFPDWPETMGFTDCWKVETTLDRSAPRLWS